MPLIANDPANNLHLCGSWSVEIGEQDTFGKYMCWVHPFTVH